MDDEHDDIRGDAVWAQHNVGVGHGWVCVLVLCGEWTFVCGRVWLVMCMVCSGDERSVEACFRRILSPRDHQTSEEAPSGAPAVVDGRETPEHRNFKST